MTAPTDVGARLAGVRERIAAAAASSGRDPSDVRLVVVTKEVPAGRVREALEAGTEDLGESRAQELVRKMHALAAVTPPPRWHFVGTLQRNKARLVVGRVALIHSLDSVPLGEAIASHARAEGVDQEVLVQVNVSGERSKHGVDPDRAWEVVASLSGMRGVRVRGLMTIAPAGLPAAARATFAGLRELRDRMRSELGGEALEELSMGMTSDFEAAVEEGATIVRVGRAIFGPRG